MKKKFGNTLAIAIEFTLSLGERSESEEKLVCGGMGSYSTFGGYVTFELLHGFQTVFHILLA